jgi:plastocyanin
MTTRTIRAVLAVAVIALVVIPWASPSSAGGGCHSDITQGRGDTVAMAEACFTPSILRVGPGTQVTFVNKDSMVHNVSANDWGFFGDMSQGDVFRATFDGPGIYPYACSYHQGMTGAIVVGDGTGAGSGDLVTIDGEEPASAGGPVPVASPQGSGLGWLAAGVAGVLLGAGMTMLARRRGREGP